MTEGIAQPTESGTPEQNQRAEAAIAEIQGDLGDIRTIGDVLASRDELMKKPERDEPQEEELRELNNELEKQFGPRTQEVISEWGKAEGVRAAARELEK